MAKRFVCRNFAPSLLTTFPENPSLGTNPTVLSVRVFGNIRTGYLVNARPRLPADSSTFGFELEMFGETQ